MATMSKYTASYPAGESLVSAQFCFVKLNSSGQAVLCGAGDDPVGVLQNKPASGAAAIVALCGTGQRQTIKADGSTIVVGSTLKSDANGLATVTTTDGNLIGAKADEASSSANDLIVCRLRGDHGRGV